MASTSWDVRLLREGEERALYDLDKAVSGEAVLPWEKWVLWWKWWNTQNPLGPSRIWVAADGARIVGQYASHPARVMVDGNEVHAVLNTDLMTHPEYRRQGVFVALKAASLADASARGMCISSVGFPNAAALPGHRKYGSAYLGRMHRAVRILNWDASAGYFVRSRVLRAVVRCAGKLVNIGCALMAVLSAAPAGIAIEEVQTFHPDIESLTRGLAHKHRVYVVRSWQYMNWRYSNPVGTFSRLIAVRGGTTVGYAVVSLHTIGGLRVGTILDCVGDSQLVVRALLVSAVKQNASLCDILRFEFTPRHEYFGPLLQSGFVYSVGMPGARFFVHCSPESSYSSVLKRRRNWFLTLGDSDAL